MEDLIIKKFLSVDGSGSGDGSGYGSGSGYGNSSGSGSGAGSGNGDGDGSGSGNGSGSSNGFDYGAGDGSGNGYGYGNGSGYGENNGSGSGSGNGSGSDDGSGFGSGDKHNIRYKINGVKSDKKHALTKLNGYDVYYIDNIPCIFNHIKGNIAKVSIIREDMSLDSAYIARYDGVFAHGKTAREALIAAENKYYAVMSFNKSAAIFKKETDPHKRYPARYFFNWHGRLTGSCEFGRLKFAQEHDINLDKDEITLEQFFTLVIGSYGSDKIELVKNQTANI